MRVCWLVLLILCACGNKRHYHRIEAVDAGTGRGVPLVEFAPLNTVLYYTDSNGLIAFHEPHLMGHEVFFAVSSHGYEAPLLPGTDLRGVKLTPVPGGRSTVKLRRVNIAERLYRLTGEGIYRDTFLLGEKCPIQQPLLNAQVLGIDGASTVVFRRRLFWFFGDTNGLNDLNLSSAAAVSRLPRDGGLDPAVGVDLEFFVKPSGFTKAMVESAAGGLTWPYSPMVLADESGVERLIVRFDSGAGLGKAPRERGLAAFNETRQIFEPLAKWDLEAPVYPDGVAFPVDVKGVRHFYFADGSPVPRTRVPARWRDVIDLTHYERLPVRESAIADIATGRTLKLRSTSIQWNAFRRRWIMLAQQVDGETSKLGEIWYLEADTPRGPWTWARHIVTHDRYAFYEVVHHPAFDHQGGRLIYFSGTYSDFLSSPKNVTPRYDYNLIMYRLDLADPGLALPDPVYRLQDGSLGRDFSRARSVEYFMWPDGKRLAPPGPGPFDFDREAGPAGTNEISN